MTFPSDKFKPGDLFFWQSKSKLDLGIVIESDHLDCTWFWINRNTIKRERATSFYINAVIRDNQVIYFSKDAVYDICSEPLTIEDLWAKLKK